MNYLQPNARLVWLFLFLFLAISAEGLTAQDAKEKAVAAAETTVPDTALVGLYVVNMYDFDIGDGAYSTEFWFWSVHKNKEITFESSPEVVGTKKADFSNYFMEQKGDVYWVNKKCRARVIQDWDVRKFPFDRQVLKIKVEETQMDISDIVYVPDVENTKVDSQMILEEWTIDSISVAAVPSVYNTTYGDPTLSGISTYAALETSFYMTRLSSWILLIKMTTGLYVAFLISLLVFTILPPDSESRIGLAVGGLFAAVGNKYIVESIVPTSTQTTLVDNLHNVTFLFILIIVAAVIYATNIFVKGKEERSKQVDRIAFGLILVSFIVINFFLISSAAAA